MYIDVEKVAMGKDINTNKQKIKFNFQMTKFEKKIVLSKVNVATLMYLLNQVQFVSTSCY